MKAVLLCQGIHLSRPFCTLLLGLHSELPSVDVSESEAPALLLGFRLVVDTGIEDSSLPFPSHAIWSESLAPAQNRVQIS